MKEKIAASKTLKKVFLKIAAIVKENILESAFHVDCYQATKMHANNLLPIFPSQTVTVLLYEAKDFYEVAFTLFTKFCLKSWSRTDQIEKLSLFLTKLRGKSKLQIRLHKYFDLIVQ